jgi:hypothetical protein
MVIFAHKKQREHFSFKKKGQRNLIQILEKCVVMLA